MLHRMQTVTGRQVILSTQSSDLLEDPGIGLNEVFLLLPGEEDTEVKSAAKFEDIQPLLEGGLTMGEAVMPRTSPGQAAQLPLFADE
jgi:hypothetical protein